MGDTLDGGGIGAPSSGHNNFLRDQSLVGILSSQLKPNLINTALAQYARRHSNFPGVTGQPNLDLPNSLLMGHNFGVFDATYESRGSLRIRSPGSRARIWQSLAWTTTTSTITSFGRASRPCASCCRALTAWWTSPTMWLAKGHPGVFLPDFEFCRGTLPSRTRPAERDASSVPGDPRSQSCGR